MKKVIFVIIAVLLCVAVLAVAFFNRAEQNDTDFQEIVTAPELIPDTDISDAGAQADDSLQTETQTVLPLENPEEIEDSELEYEDRFLLVINTGHSLAESYVPHLEEALENSGIYLEKQAAEAFSDMYTDALANGIMLTPTVGYTGLSRQQKLFDAETDLYVEQGYSEEEAKALAAKTVLPAGCSEHNAGLAVDIGSDDENFTESSAYRWLTENAYKYGFIERYTSENAESTGMNAQPWHWRYVGSDINARNINESGLSLEEWVANTEAAE